MTSKKLTNVLKIITDSLMREQILYSLIGTYHVIQPTDYIVLKLMAIANNPDRSQKDESDILAVMNLYKNSLIPENFEPLDMERVYLFAEKFSQKEKAKRYFDEIFGWASIRLKPDVIASLV